MSDVQITFTAQPRITLGPNQIEFNGAVFDCNTCTAGGLTCCGTLVDNKEQCFKCSCQDKGINRCKRDAACNGICDLAFATGGLGCSCSGKTSNQFVFGAATTIVQPCSQAIAILSDPQQQFKVSPATAKQITVQCLPATRLRCCQGDITLGETACGKFWGPNNTEGACDTIMLDFCNSNPKDPLCNCITVSSGGIPNPECFDIRCTTTNAMRLARQINNDCNSTFIQCNQFFNLSPEAKNNLVTGNTIAQTCNANLNSSGEITPTGASNSTLGVGAIVGISIGIVVFVLALGLGLGLGLKKLNKKKVRKVSE